MKSRVTNEIDGKGWSHFENTGDSVDDNDDGGEDDDDEKKIMDALIEL